jgi:hypothetical protein
MTKTEVFARQAEAELRSQRKISAETCRSCLDFDDEGRTAFMYAIAFICGEQHDQKASKFTITRPADRTAASRLMLLTLCANTLDPRWSSEVLRRYVRAVLETPGGTLSDVFAPLVDLLGELFGGLSASLANFLKDLIVLCFTEYRNEYELVPWARVAEAVSLQLTQAQCYFGLHAIPPQYMTPQLARAISDRLALTAYQEDATGQMAV